MNVLENPTQISLKTLKFESHKHIPKHEFNNKNNNIVTYKKDQTSPLKNPKKS